MLALYYLPQCLGIACLRFFQLYINSIPLFPKKASSVFRFLMVSTIAIAAFSISIIHITIVFTERFLFGALITPSNKLRLYIIGAPRSGTTRLHKLLANDTVHFTSMKMWEMFLAPSVAQKAILILIGKVDALCGSYVSKFITTVEQKMFSNFNTIHHLSIFNVEEDALLLFHLFSTYHLSFLLGKEQSYTSLNYNQKIPQAIWVYYNLCIENHLVFNPNKTYLSKNPFLTSAINELKNVHSNTKFIFLKRSIQNVAPSFFSMKRFLSNVFYGKNPSQQQYIAILDVLENWQKKPSNNKDIMLINYTQLKTEPSNAVEKTYDFANISLNDHQSLFLKKEDKSAKSYKSKHEYHISDFLTNC